jgi:mannose-1-phosphate guanylyltransferase
MAHVRGRPFLETLLRQLVWFGFHRVILAVGHAGGAIQSYFGERFCGIEIEYSKEPSPLETGGALGDAAGFIRTNSCLVMNGDSYTDVDLHQVARAHRESGADISVVVVPVDERQDIGSVLLDADQSVLQFAEKEPSHSARHLNAGIYMLTRAVINTISAASAVSLERELFPQWIREGRGVRAFVHSRTC